MMGVCNRMESSTHWLPWAMQHARYLALGPFLWEASYLQSQAGDFMLRLCCFHDLAQQLWRAFIPALAQDVNLISSLPIEHGRTRPDFVRPDFANFFPGDFPSYIQFQQHKEPYRPIDLHTFCFVGINPRLGTYHQLQPKLLATLSGPARS